MRDLIVIYPTQKNADEALRRTIRVFGVETLDRVDRVRRKITLCDGNTIRFLSENNLCHKLESVSHGEASLIDCWSWNKALDKHEELKTKHQLSFNTVSIHEGVETNVT